MERELEKFVKDMDKLIEESGTDHFADYGDPYDLICDITSIFLAFKDKMKANDIRNGNHLVF